MAVLAPFSPVTAEELFHMPDDGGRCELVNGEIIRLEPGGAEHGVVTARIGHLIQEFVAANALGLCCGVGTGFILQRDPDSGTPTAGPRQRDPDVVRAPDAAFVASGRIPVTGVPVSYWPFAPDLLVEVVSPSDRLADVHVKIAEYFAAGTRLVWLVEPETRMVHVYRSARQVDVLGMDDVLDGGDVLPGFRSPVRNLFPPDRRSR